MSKATEYDKGPRTCEERTVTPSLKMSSIVRWIVRDPPSKVSSVVVPSGILDNDLFVDVFMDYLHTCMYKIYFICPFHLTALLATRCLCSTPDSASGSLSSPSRVSLPTLAKALFVGAKRVRGAVPFKTSAVGRLSKAAARAATRVVKRSSAARVSSRVREPVGVWEGTTPPGGRGKVG